MDEGYKCMFHWLFRNYTSFIFLILCVVAASPTHLTTQPTPVNRSLDGK